MSNGQAKKKHEEVLKLIGLYRSHTCLWDNNMDASKSINTRKMALDEIAERMEASSEDVRRKLHNLRSQYRRETIRMKRLKTNRPKWLYYNALKFLGGSIKIKEDKNNMNSSVYLKINKAERRSTEIESEVDDDNGVFNESRLPNLSSRSDNQKSQIYTNNDGITHIGHEEKGNSKGVFVISRDHRENRDEYEVFGENVANELRSLENNKQHQQALKCAILQAILDVNKVSYHCPTIQEAVEIEEELQMEDY